MWVFYVLLISIFSAGERKIERKFCCGSIEIKRLESALGVIAEEEQRDARNGGRKFPLSLSWSFVLLIK